MMKKDEPLFLRLLLGLNFVIFPFFWSGIVLLVLGEIFNFWSAPKKLIIDPWWLVIFAGLSSFFARSTLESKKGMRRIYPFYRLFYLANKLFLSSFLFLTLVVITFGKMMIGERSLLRTFYLSFPLKHLEVVLMAFFLAFLWLFFGFAPLFAREKKAPFKGNIFSLINLPLIVILMILIVSFSSFSRQALVEFGKISRHLSASYDWKMREQIGPFYDYILFVKASTPQDALIMCPAQQSHWPAISNQGYTRYFLYPRKLVGEDEDEARKNQASYIFIIGRDNLAGQKNDQWPQEKIAARRLFYMPDTPDKPAIILEKDYDPKDEINNRWGIIELKK